VDDHLSSSSPSPQARARAPVSCSVRVTAPREATRDPGGRVGRDIPGAQQLSTSQEAKASAPDGQAETRNMSDSFWKRRVERGTSEPGGASLRIPSAKRRAVCPGFPCVAHQGSRYTFRSLPARPLTLRCQRSRDAITSHSGRCVRPGRRMHVHRCTDSTGTSGQARDVEATSVCGTVHWFTMSNLLWC
jgi:hypothetical protein